ncbi:MAG: aminoacyl-histidine dipeptidase [Ignavibacteriaceae bacterium]
MSDDVIKGLKPELLWKYFYEIAQVPRPSKKEGKIIEHIKNFANKKNLQYKVDKVGNIVISIPATKGFEKSPTVVLQGHIDMVCEKNKGTQHDFDNDPIKLIKEDGWITADGTTLGSDNGIGVATALAAGTDNSVTHGPLEILLTIDEETGLTGANNLEPGFITGKILLNLDSEEDGSFYVGCSGGVDTLGYFTSEALTIPEGKNSFEIVITGLKGGHSGLDINTGRANAIKLLARALKSLENFDYNLISINGGSKRNAIPREAEAVIFIKSSEEKMIAKTLNGIQADFLNEFSRSDNKLKIEFQKSEDGKKKVFTNSFKDKIINTLLSLPHGIIAMSQDIPDLVETSTNVATISTGENEVTIGTSQRSSIDSAKKYIAQSVQSILSLAGAKVQTGDGYPGWKPNLDSQILKVSKSVFENLFSEKPEIKAIHAGLECGILGNKFPGLDMVSFGPTIQGAHSPDERVNIETVGKFYNLLKEILKEVASAN